MGRSERRFPAWSAILAAAALTGCGSSMSSSDSAAGYWCGEGGYGGGNYQPPGDDNSGDQFEDYGENPWIETADDDQATFAVDVDTGSYTVARRYLEAGTLPPPASVRVEEWVNYFDYAYGPPPAGSPDAVAIHVEGAPSDDEGVWLLRVALKARELPAEERGPANLVFLVDSSGSMGDEDKLPLVQRSLVMMLDGLRPDDTVGLVTYAGVSQVALEPTAVAERERIVDAIESLAASGTTNGEDGLRDAYAMAEDAFRPGGINRVILCTDGDFNVGVAGDELVALIEDFRDRGVTLSTLGFGQGNYNDRELEALADHGNGNYAYIDSLEEARRVLVEKLLSTLTVVARDAKVQVTFDAAVLRYRLVGYENRAVADDEYKDDTVDGGELGSGHEVTALFEVQLADEFEPAAQLIRVGVRYQPAEGGESTEVASPFTAGELRDALVAGSDDFRFAVAVAELARVLKQRGGDQVPDFDGIEALAAGALGPGEPADRRDFLALVDQVRSNWR